MGLKRATPLVQRFVATARLLEPWRLRSTVQCSREGLEAILPLLEHCRRDHARRLYECSAPWSAEELGVLLVEARNRTLLHQLGRDRPRDKGPRFDPSRMPDAAIDALIQRHPDMRIVEELRSERLRRHAA